MRMPDKKFILHWYFLIGSHLFAVLGLASPFKPVMDTNYYYSGL